MGTVANELRAVPSAVRQWVALELLELAQKATERAVSLDTDERYDGAVDLLSQQAHTYRTLARLLTEPTTAATTQGEPRGS